MNLPSRPGPGETFTYAHGSAKVALILLERSLEAWLTLRDHLAPDSTGIVNLILQLHRLSVMTEEQFPKALDFQRPGFDGGGLEECCQ